MAKIITVSCKHCGSPTKVKASGEPAKCVWCKREASSQMRNLGHSDRCEKCGSNVGDNFCPRCTGSCDHQENRKSFAVTKEAVEFQQKSKLIGPYISWGQFNRDIIDFSDSLKGKGYDAVIGVPRSGLVVASQMSIRMGLPLYSISEYGPIYLGGGLRVRDRFDLSDHKKALLVEDSTATGFSMREAVEWMDEAMRTWNVRKAAVYATGSQTKKIDEYHRKLELPHWFEWNLLWNKMVMEGLNVCVDFDGILCPDFTTEQDDDGWRYIEAMKSAKSLATEGTHIHGIVTARLEKYRPWTEDWLRKHGITFNYLIMGKWETKDERSTQCIGSYKAKKATELGAKLFVESCPLQAKVIRSKSNIAVLCPKLGGSIAK